MRSTIAAALLAAARNSAGKIDTTVLLTSLVRRGHSEFEAAEHMIVMGCNADLAYRRAYEAIAAR